VVSSSGTSLTQGQIKLIRRYSQNVTILYDGDAAGIKASFRGIDLLLSEGLNVRVVLFPDGDDPDSYSKKVSQEALLQYITSNKKDFVTFKAEILLNENQANDPIQRAKLIHEIVQSISLIPDSISRTVYTKDIAAKFDIDELIIQQELAKLRKNNLSKAPAPNETPAENAFLPTGTPELPTKVALQTKTIARVNHTEEDLLRILIKYGPFAVEIEQQDEHGKDVLVEVSVAELICHELHRDELTFNHTAYNRIYQQISEGLTQQILYKSSYFMRSEDQEIVKIVSEFESENYELSHNWLTLKNIETNYEIDKLKSAVMTSIYTFKTDKIQQRIDEIRVTLSTISEDEIAAIEDLLIEQITLEKVKIAFAEKLGRIILR
jgi:DNA primase